MSIQDEMSYENRMTLNSIQNMIDSIRTYQEQNIKPFPMSHPWKRDTAFLQFDEGHYLARAYKDMKQALDCYKERYQIHVAAETGEHAVVAVDHRPKWNRWSQREDVQGIRARAYEREDRTKGFGEE